MHALFVVQIIVTIFLVIVVLLQKSSNDGFTAGGGSSNGLFTARGSANFLTRLTAILATIFMLNSLVLAYLATHREKSESLIDTVIESEKSDSKSETAPVEPKKPVVPLAE